MNSYLAWHAIYACQADVFLLTDRNTLQNTHSNVESNIIMSWNSLELVKLKYEKSNVK